MAKFGVILGLVMIAIAFILYPIVLDGAQAILDWNACDSGCVNGESYQQEFSNLTADEENGNYTSFILDCPPCTCDKTVIMLGLEITVPEVPGDVEITYVCATRNFGMRFEAEQLEVSGNLTYDVCCGVCNSFPGLCPIVRISPLIVFCTLLFGGMLVTGISARALARKKS